ncbi:MAG: response regulator, partial [Rhodopila sp.]
STLGQRTSAEIPDRRRTPNLATVPLVGDGSPVDAVILDCIMPGELGPELALHAKSLRLPVVMISGSPDAMEFADENGFQFLAKPFHFDDLIAALEKALSSGPFGQWDA